MPALLLPLRPRLALIALLACCVLTGGVNADGRPHLVRAVICEGLKAGQPLGPAVIFSVRLGRIACLAEFEGVAERSEVFHTWYQRDSLSSRVRLALSPPRWSTFNSIQLQPEDIGPWRVEITDAKGRLLQILRFSVTE